LQTGNGTTFKVRTWTNPTLVFSGFHLADLHPSTLDMMINAHSIYLCLILTGARS
jgi:hypothetical protein